MPRYLQVGDSFTTRFAAAFLPLAPALGGTPAGADLRDATVLDPGFRWDTAAGTERARYSVVMSAADDWATAIGTILAHEIGHAVGLVAPGRSSDGLHGDETYHNEFAAPEDVMAASTGFESLVELEHSFRDLNLAYLRHRVLVKR